MNMAAVVVHSAEDVRRTLDAAAGSPVMVISAEDGAAVIGADFFAAMVSEGAARAGAPAPEAWLDCGNLPGLVMGALRHGCRRILFAGPSSASKKLNDIAAQQGAVIASRPADAFDLGHPVADDAALAAYIRKV